MASKLIGRTALLLRQRARPQPRTCIRHYANRSAAPGSESTTPSQPQPSKHSNVSDLATFCGLMVLPFYMGMSAEDNYHSVVAAHQFANRHTTILSHDNTDSSSYYENGTTTNRDAYNVELPGLPVLDSEKHRGKLLLVSGVLDSDDSRKLDDCDFQLRQNRYEDRATQNAMTMPWLTVSRIVEMYQWNQKHKNDINQSYFKEWSTQHIDSQGFRAGRRNPKEMEPRSETTVCQQLFVKAHDTTAASESTNPVVKLALHPRLFGSDNNNDFHSYLQQCRIQPIQVNYSGSFPVSFNGKTFVPNDAAGEGYLYFRPPGSASSEQQQNGMAFHGKDIPDSPAIGDTRVKFEIFPRHVVSFWATLSDDGKQLVPCSIVGQRNDRWWFGHNNNSQRVNLCSVLHGLERSPRSFCKLSTRSAQASRERSHLWCALLSGGIALTNRPRFLGSNPIQIAAWIVGAPILNWALVKLADGALYSFHHPMDGDDDWAISALPASNATGDEFEPRKQHGPIDQARTALTGSWFSAQPAPQQSEQTMLQRKRTIKMIRLKQTRGWD